MMFFFFFASLAPVAKGFTNGGGISAKALRFADPTALFSVQLETPPAPSKTKIERLKAELELAEEWKKSNDSVRPVPLHVMDGDQEVLSKPLNGMNGATPIEKPTENFFEEEQKENRPVLKFPDPPIISSPSLPGSNGSSQASKADVVKKLKIELDRASNFFEEVQMDYAEMKDDSNQLDEESSAVSDLASAEPVSTSKPKIQTGMQQTIESEPKKEPTLSHTVSSLDKVVDAAARDSVKTKIEKLKQELQLAKKFFEEELAEKTSVSDSIIPVQNDAPPETVESFVTQLPRSSVSTLSVPSAKASVDVPAVSRKTNIERLKKELDLHREFFDTLLKEKEQIVPPKLSLNEESEEKAFSDVVPKSPSLSSRKWETIIPNQASNVEIPLRPSPTATALPDVPQAASLATKIDRIKRELQFAREFFDFETTENKKVTEMLTGEGHVVDTQPDAFEDISSSRPASQTQATSSEGSLESIGTLADSGNAAQTDTLSTVPIKTKIDRLKVELKLAQQFFRELQTQISAKVSTDLRAPIELDDTNIGAKELDNTNFRQEDSGPVEPERQCDTGTAASIRARIDRLKVELELARKFFDELHHESRTKTTLDSSEPMEKGKANVEAEEPDVVIEYKSEVSVPVKPETTTKISNDDAQTDTLSTVPIRTKIDRLKVELKLARQFFGDLQTQSSAKVSTDLRAPIELDDTNIGAKELDNTNFRQEDSGPVEPERQCDTGTAASIRARIDRLKVELEFARKFFDELHHESRTKTSLDPSEPMEKGKANMEAEEPDVVIEYKSEVSVPVKSETTTEISNDDAQTDTLSTVPIRTKIDRLKVELELARQFFGELQTQSSAKVSTVLRAPIELDDNNIGAKGLDNTNFRQEDSGPVEPERHCDTGAAASIRARTDRLKVELELARKFFDELHHESRTKTTLDSSEPMEKGKANVEAEEPDAIIEYKSEVSVPVNSETMTIHASTRTKIDRLKVELHLAQQFFEELHLESSANGAHDRYMPDEVIEAYTDDQEPGFVVEPTGPLSAVSTPAKQISSFAISDISAVSVRTKIDGLKRELELAREFFREQYAQPVSATSMGLDSEKATEKESEDDEMDTMQYEVELVDIPPSNSVESDITSESDDAPSTLLQTKIRRLKGELDLARQFFEESVTASSRTAYRRNQNGKVAYIEADAEVSKSRSSQHILPTCLSTPTEEAQESPLATLESASNALETTEIYQNEKQNEKPLAPLGTKISRLKKELQLARKFFDEAIDDSNAVIKSFAEIKLARDILSGKPKPEEGLSPSTKTNHFTPAVANIEGTRDYIIDSPVLKASAEPSSSIKATISEPSSLTNPISSIDDAVDLSIVAPTDAAPTDSQTLEPVVPATDSTIDSVNDADVGEPCSLKEEMELLKAQIERAREWQETGPAIKPAPSVVPGYRSVADPLIDLKRSHSPDVARSSFKTEIELLEFQLELAMDWQKVNMAFMPAPPKSEPFSETALSSADEAYESLRTKIELLKDQLEHAKEEWNAKKSKMEPTPWISLIDLADLSNGQTVTSGPHETDDFVDVSFSSDNTDWTTEPASSMEEMDLLREQIDRAKKWRETTLEPAFPIFNGVRPLSDPLNNATKPPTIPDLPTISSPKFPGTK